MLNVQNPAEITPAMLADMVEIEEAAKILGISRYTLYGMTSAKTIPFYKREGKRKIKFKKQELMEWMCKNIKRIG